MTANDGLSMLMCSCASIIACISVIAAYLVFPSLRIKTSKEVICYVVLSNLLVAIGIAFGEFIPSRHCWFVAIFTNVFTLSATMWTVVISVMIQYLVTNKRPIKIELGTHFICWGVPVIATLLPLVNAGYGMNDAINWCWVVATPRTPHWVLIFWYWESFYGIMWSGFIAMISFYISSVRSVQNVDSDARWAVNRAMMLHCYPLVIAVSWGPTSLFDFLAMTNNSFFDTHRIFASFANVLPCLQGVLACMVFWGSHDDIRQYLWEFVTTGRMESTMYGRVSSQSLDSTLFSAPSLRSTSSKPKPKKRISKIHPVASKSSMEDTASSPRHATTTTTSTTTASNTIRSNMDSVVGSFDPDHSMHRSSYSLSTTSFASRASGGGGGGDRFRTSPKAHSAHRSSWGSALQVTDVESPSSHSHSHSRAESSAAVALAVGLFTMRDREQERERDYLHTSCSQEHSTHAHSHRRSAAGGGAAAVPAAGSLRLQEQDEMSEEDDTHHHRPLATTTTIANNQIQANIYKEDEDNSIYYD